MTEVHWMNRVVAIAGLVMGIITAFVIRGVYVSPSKPTYTLLKAEVEFICVMNWAPDKDISYATFATYTTLEEAKEGCLSPDRIIEYKVTEEWYEITN